jgi:heptosyltransferase III
MSNSIDLTNKRIIISRTDSIGDVMLTLPICAWIKENFSGVQLLFLGNDYTKPVIDSFTAIDNFLDWKEIEALPSAQRVECLKSMKADIILHVFPRKEIAVLAKKAKIPIRIGTSHRTFHFWTCTHRPHFTRKNSILHEAQLNFELLKPFGLTHIPSPATIHQYLPLFQPSAIELPLFLQEKMNSDQQKIILHPKSQGSALEWPIEKYKQLALELTKKNFLVFFTGTEKEGDNFRNHIEFGVSIVDTSGKLNLAQLIVLISKCQALVACSTGPLHIAGFLNIHTIGLFSPRKPIHPGRWKALGSCVDILVHHENCPSCAKKKGCHCVENISVEEILNII